MKALANMPRIHSGPPRGCSWPGFAISAILLAIFALSLHASAQTTTISGKVYDPRTTADALPLPGVLVYVTTDAVAPLPGGVQCLTEDSAPTGAVAYTNSGVDGSFTLKNVQVNTSYTLVIQAGKWRRQFGESVDTVPITGLKLHMPSNRSQGDIPKIAIATGAVDGVECVLRDMGVADSEFTDDNSTTNPDGRIHLYQGNGNPGAVINPSTPSDRTLTGDLANLDSYDMVMFPCQGGSYVQSDAAMSNLVKFANAGGRVFTTHYSYVWLDPESPYNSQFPPVANWHPNYADPNPDPGLATIDTSFTDGATMAQWLKNAGATAPGQPNEIQISTLRHDIDSVIPPTQSWLKLIDKADGDPVMQITFNTPVNAPAPKQCGRVLFNEYHVRDLVGTGLSYPTECPTGPMSAQEEMLEYALFDLSAFVKPVVVPNVSVSFNPSPMVVKQSDSTDVVTINVSNTSTNTQVDPSATLSITLPSGLTAVAINDPTNGWNCALNTLKCTRTSSIPSSQTDAVTLTVSVGARAEGSQPNAASLLTVTVSSPTFSNDVVATDPVIFQQKVLIDWPTPTPIAFGTALSATQLNAASTVRGTFVYSPAMGTELPTGEHTLTAVFTPVDQTDYASTTATVSLTVVPLNPSISVSPTPNPAFLSNAVSITAAIPSPAGSPTGSVKFYDGATQLGAGTISGGRATFTTSALGMGTHTITAVYSGDVNFRASSSVAIQETIQDFNLAHGPGSSGTPTIYPGGEADYSFQVAPLGGSALAGAVSLSVEGLPPGATAEFSPAAIAVHSGATSVTLHVKTPSLASAAHEGGPFGREAIPVALGMLLLPFASRLRKAGQRWMPMVLLSVVGAAFAMGLTGCGAVSYTPKSFTMMVTGSSGNLSHTSVVKITVE